MKPMALRAVRRDTPPSYLNGAVALRRRLGGTVQWIAARAAATASQDSGGIYSPGWWGMSEEHQNLAAATTARMIAATGHGNSEGITRSNPSR